MFQNDIYDVQSISGPGPRKRIIVKSLCVLIARNLHANKPISTKIILIYTHTKRMKSKIYNSLKFLQLSATFVHRNKCSTILQSNHG